MLFFACFWAKWVNSNYANWVLIHKQTMKNELVAKWEKDSKKNFVQNQKMLQKLKQRPTKNLQDLSEKYHEEAFEKINCLDCANCCKTISPSIRMPDIKQIAKFLSLSETQVIETYLVRDAQDGDYVVKSSPCPFLDLAYNTCQIYEVRPRACRAYPHTDHVPFEKLASLHAQNTLVCPAAFWVVERIRQKMENY